MFLSTQYFFSGQAGRYTNEAGFMSYYEICDFLREDNTTLVWDNEQMVPFAYRENQWVGFDDERSLKTKVYFMIKTYCEFLRSKDLIRPNKVSR